jgi:dolichol-phosphate mannosyltransferase
MIPIEVPLDTGDFRLMSRRIVVVLRGLRETHRFVRGLVAWLGFKQTAVLYDRPVRFAGETKYPFAKMLRFAIDGITSFSILPLRFATYLGMLISALSVAVAVWAVLARFVFHATVPGWTTVIVLVSLLASVQLIMTGILGEYIGRIYEQVKLRPIYVLSELINFSGESANDASEAAKPAESAGERRRCSRGQRPAVPRRAAAPSPPTGKGAGRGRRTDSPRPRAGSPD